MPVNAVEFQFRANQTYWLLAAGRTTMRRGRLLQPRRSAWNQVDVVSPISSLNLNLWVVYCLNSTRRLTNVRPADFDAWDRVNLEALQCMALLLLLVGSVRIGYARAVPALPLHGSCSKGYMTPDRLVAW